MGAFQKDNDLLFHAISKKKTSNLPASFCGTFEMGRGGGGGVIVILSEALIVRQLFLYERRDKKS